MKTILLLLIFFSCHSNLFAQTATWQNPLPQGNKLNDVYFIDINTGWAVGDGGVIMKTTNGGTTWTVSYHSNCIGLNKVFFISNLIGWAVGIYGTIINTTDGGQTWVAQNSGIQTNLFAVQFTNTSNGIAVGDLGVTLRTSNGGATWTLGGSVSLNPILNDLFSDNAGNSWVVGTAGRIAKSTDGGTTWEDMVSGTNITLKAIQFQTSMIGWAAGNLGVMLKSVDGGATWTTSNTGITNSYNFVDIAFIDQNNGFAADTKGFIFKTTNGGANWSIVLSGNLSSTITILSAISLQSINNIIAVGNKGNIQKSTDSGVSWTSILSGVSSNNTGSSVFFTDANNGWVASRGSTNEKLLKTTTGGNTWTAKLSNPNLQLNEVFFINDAIGWVAGDNGVSANGKIFKTIDGGDNWAEQVLSGSTVVSLYDVQFINSTVGLTVGAGGKIFSTINGGSNWNSQSSGITESIYSVFFLDANTAWCAGANGKILKSTNGGINWSEQTSGLSSNIRDIFFLNVNNGYAVTENGSFLKTTNGGTSWIAQNLGPSSIGGTITLISVKFFDTNNGITLGFDYLRGIYYTTTNGGTTWVTNYLPMLGGLAPATSFIKDYFVLNQSTFFMAGNFSSILKFGVTTCNSTLTPSGTVSDNQKAANSVNTSGINTIPNASNVIYQGGNFVQLNAGFLATTGSVFTAKILSACQ